MSDEDRRVLIESSVGLVFSILAALLWHAGHEAWAIFLLMLYVTGISVRAGK